MNNIMEKEISTVQALCKHGANTVLVSGLYGERTNTTSDKHIASPIHALFSAGGEVEHG